jgi:hypothetical protein
MRRIIAFLWMVLGAAAFASPIPVVSVTGQAGGLILQMRPGVLRLDFSGERTIHVFYAPDGIIPSHFNGFAATSVPAAAPTRTRRGCRFRNSSKPPFVA